MISPEHCRTMARYNAWQNRQMQEALEMLPPDALTEERGAFFGTLLATVNHILWADGMWMSRLAGGPVPEGGIAASVTLTPMIGAWGGERLRMDSRISQWADELGEMDLAGSLDWFSGASGRQMSASRALCVAHMFNHQTHHRGQVHAMATAAGAKSWTTDLFLMPQA